MGVYVGRECKATLGSTTISEMTDYNFSIEAPLLGEDTFGNDGFNTVAGAGTKSAKGSMSGLTDTSDTEGQVILENAVISGTKITNLQLYVNDTEYWCSDTALRTTAGVYFSNYNTTVAAGDIVKFSVDFEFNGPIHKTS